MLSKCHCKNKKTDEPLTEIKIGDTVVSSQTLVKELGDAETVGNRGQFDFMATIRNTEELKPLMTNFVNQDIQLELVTHVRSNEELEPLVTNLISREGQLDLMKIVENQGELEPLVASNSARKKSQHDLLTNSEKLPISVQESQCGSSKQMSSSLIESEGRTLEIRAKESNDVDDNLKALPSYILRANDR